MYCQPENLVLYPNSNGSYMERKSITDGVKNGRTTPAKPKIYM